MQINLQIHIHLDGVDLDSYITRLALLFAPQSPPSPQTAPEAIQGPNVPALPPTAQEAATPLATEAAAVVEPTPQPAPTKAVPEKRPAVLPGETDKPKRVYSGDRLKFEEFDTLVRSEMKRLSLDKRIPSYRLWEEEQDPRLPTLGAVCQRYGVGTLPALAKKLDMLPPLSASNGVKVAAI